MSRLQRIEEFKDNVNKEWSKKYLSFVLENQDKELNWYALSQNPNITMDIIKENLDLENLGIGFGYLIVQI